MDKKSKVTLLTGYLWDGRPYDMDLKQTTILLFLNSKQPVNYAYTYLVGRIDPNSKIGISFKKPQ